MKKPVLVNLVVEDHLSEAVVRKILSHIGGFDVNITYGYRGCDYIREKLPSFKRAAQFMPYIVVVDLDDDRCAPKRRTDWVGTDEPNLLFRVAVREIESWVLAHRSAVSRWLGISVARIPSSLDAVPDPKRFMIKLARHSRSREVRADVVPVPKSTAKQGPNYNGRLSEFVGNYWDPDAAKTCSPSLFRAVRRIAEFRERLKPE